MKVLKAGTRITTVIGDIEAIIIGVCITMETVEYRCRYFSGGDEKTVWLYRYEIETAVIKQKAGFGKKEIIQDCDSEVLLIQ